MVDMPFIAIAYHMYWCIVLLSYYREMEWRLDKEGREYHHYEDFCKLYRAEIVNLNRMLDTLQRNGMIPNNLELPTGATNLSNVSLFCFVSYNMM